MRKALACVGAVAVISFVGEAVLRLLAPFPDYSGEIIRSFPDQYHPLLGYSGVPNLDQWFILPDFKHRILNNSRGFRDRERSYEKGDRKRIVVLGDSTAWGWGVEAQERFSDLMEKMLAGWEVINLAQSGYSTDQELILLETEGMKYDPEIVLLLFDRNDVVEGNNARVIDGMQPKPYFVREDDALVLKNVPVPYDPRYWELKARLARSYGGPRAAAPSVLSWEYWRRNILPKSHFYNWLSFRLAHPVWKKSTSKDADKSVRQMEEEMALTRDILRRMESLCGAQGARFVVADVPSAYSPLLRRFCSDENIPYIDLKPALERSLLPVQHRRVGHWNRRGHRLVADAMIRYLKEKDLLASGEEHPQKLRTGTTDEHG